MAKIVRKVTKKFFIISNCVVVVLFLLACLAAYLHPQKFWFIAVLGIGFPIITAFVLFFIFFWWFFRSRWAFLSLAACIIGWPQLNLVFAWHPFAAFNAKQKDSSTVRIMQWNVARLDQMSKNRPGGSHRAKIYAYIKKMNPDVLCLQEFLESNNPKLLEENIPYIKKELGLPYYYFARDHSRYDNLYEHGVAIFSRYPITDTLRLRYAGSNNRPGESLIYADVNIKGTTLRVYTTHLQSLRFAGDDYNKLKQIVNAEDSALANSKNILKKFRLAYTFRSPQAEMVRRELDSSPYPEIICGDFNDVPNSFTYRKIKGSRNDAFLKGGFGIGRTFTSLSPTLRIDYIMANKKLQLVQFDRTRTQWSDHYPLVADFKLPVNE